MPELSTERAAVLIALIRSCSDKCAYQMSIVDIAENSVIASRYAVTDARVASRVSALLKPLLRAGDREARGHALDVVLERAGQRLVEVVQVEHEGSFRRRVHAEVREMRVAAQLDVQPGRRRVLQIGGHDLRRAAIERERRHHHAPVTDGHEVGLARRVLRFEQRDGIRSVRRGRPPRVVRGSGLRARRLPLRLSLLHTRVRDCCHGLPPYLARWAAGLHCIEYRLS